MSNQVKTIPDGYHTLTPYLIVKGTSKAIEFYTKALGAKEIFRMEMDGGVIGHAEVQIGNSRFMIADEFPDMEGVLGPASCGGTPVTFMIYVDNVDAVSERALSVGMKIKKPITDQFYGDRSGTFVDPFGHVWTIATHKEDVPPEELKKRMNELYKK